MAVEELTLLDGRYQLIRQLSGPPRAPLMVASDLKTGRVVCVRLQQFSTARASLAAVPLLTLDVPSSGDGPLLPYDFGVDEGTAYLVRDFVTATSLQQLLAAPELPSPLDIVSMLRRAGDALLAAAAEGFRHPGLALRHILVAPDGTVRVSGYDGAQQGQKQTDAKEGDMLAALVPQALAGRPTADLPPAVRTLVTRSKTWQVAAAPELDIVVRYLRRCEEQLLGYSRLGEAATAITRIAAALFRRVRHLGPLLHPYLIVLTLVVAIVGLATRTLTSPATPGRLLVYPVPTRASDGDVASYPFAIPPQVPMKASAVETTATISTKLAGAAATPAPNNTADAGAATHTTSSNGLPPRQEGAGAPATRPEASQPPVRREAATAPSRPAVARTSSTAAETARAVATPAAPSGARSTVIVTTLTAQATTARVTVIAATSERSSVTETQTARSTAATATHVATTAAARANQGTVRGAATSTLSKAATMPAKSGTPTVAATLR